MLNLKSSIKSVVARVEEKAKKVDWSDVALKTANAINTALCVYTAVGVVASVAVLISGNRAYKNGEGTTLHNIKMEKEELEKVIKTFSKKGTPILLECDEGKIVFVHGKPDGTYWVEGQKIPADQLTSLIKSMFGSNEYILMSCYNATHSNLSDNGVSLTIDEKTATHSPIHFMLKEEGEKLNIQLWSNFSTYFLDFHRSLNIKRFMKAF